MAKDCDIKIEIFGKNIELTFTRKNLAPYQEVVGRSSELLTRRFSYRKIYLRGINK